MDHIEFLVEDYFIDARELRRKQLFRFKELTGCAFGVHLFLTRGETLPNAIRNRMPRAKISRTFSALYFSYLSTYSAESAV
nr:hypothetical protein [uncultured Draconibacterium sp.]